MPQASKAPGPRPEGSGTLDLFARRRSALGLQPLERIVQELADREDIRELTAMYAHRVAHGLSNADLFTDDGAYLHQRTLAGEAVAVRGRAALDAHFVARPDELGSATPMIHNHIIEVTGDEARAVCSIELRIGDGEGAVFASGYYQDRLRKEGGAWKFVERHVSFFRWGSVQAGGK